MNEQQLALLRKRYFQRGETWNKLCQRVSKLVASVEKKQAWCKEFYKVMHDLDFLPNTPTLTNAGIDGRMRGLSACYVLDIGDTLKSINDTQYMMLNVQKFGGGTGIAYNKMRPSFAEVSSTGGVACGPVGALKYVTDGARNMELGCKRSSANMGILRVDHPDIVKFIRCKEQEGVMPNVNISVDITDEFLSKSMDEDHVVCFGKLKGYLDAASGEFIKVKNKKVLTVGDIVDMIVDGMHRNGEPGIVFMGRINRKNPIKNTCIESTNPCGEQPLLPHESCNLGSINLYNMLRNGEFDFDKFSHVVRVAVRFLDNIVDVQQFPEELKIIGETTKKYRKVGLGVMGFADMLYALGIRYGSDESIGVADKIAECLETTARDESAKLGEEKGSFPAIKDSICQAPMRNATVTTIAPTGSISIIAGVSSGIEPVFQKTNMEIKMGTGGTGGSLTIESIGYKEYGDKHDRAVFVETKDISIDEHLRMQAVWQRHVDNGVSKTINAHNMTKREEVREAVSAVFNTYTEIKGFTFYRDGSRQIQALGAGGKDMQVGGRMKSGDVEDGRRFRKVVACGTMYIQLYQDVNSRMNEVFATMGKGGSCNYAFLEAINRILSISLQCGVPPELLIKQMKGIRCSNIVPIIQKGGAYLSCPDAIARTIQERIEELTDKKMNISAKGYIVQQCPDCGSAVAFSEGCMKCIFCGWEKCGG